LKIFKCKIYFILLCNSFFFVNCIIHKTYYSQNTNVNNFNQRNQQDYLSAVPVKIKTNQIPFQEFKTKIQFVNYDEFYNISAYLTADEIRKSRSFKSKPDANIELEVTSEIIDKENNALSLLGFFLTLGILPGKEESTYRLNVKFHNKDKNEIILEKDYFAQDHIYVSFLSMIVGPIYQLFDENVKYSLTLENKKIIQGMISNLEKDIITEFRRNELLKKNFTIKNKSYAVVPYRFKDERLRRIGKFFTMYFTALFKTDIALSKENRNDIFNLDQKIDKIENLTDLELFEHYKSDRLLLFDKVENDLEIDQIRVKILDKNVETPIYSKDYFLPRDSNFEITDKGNNLFILMYNDLYLGGEIL